MTAILEELECAVVRFGTTVLGEGAGADGSGVRARTRDMSLQMFARTHKWGSTSSRPCNTFCNSAAGHVLEIFNDSLGDAAVAFAGNLSRRVP